MCKRTYTNLKIWESEIVEMKKASRTKREIPDHLGLTKEQVKDLLSRLGRPVKDAKLIERISQQQRKCSDTYRYRRMWLWLKNNKGIYCNPKTILRIMKKYDLLSKIRRHRKWQQMGRQVHKYENLLNHQFHAQEPNSNR